jgi:hypothetical protein
MIGLRAQICFDDSRHLTNFSWHAVCDHDAVVDYNEAMDDFGDSADRVIDQYNGEAGCVLNAQYIDKFLNFRSVESGQRLVKQQ